MKFAEALQVVRASYNMQIATRPVYIGRDWLAFRQESTGTTREHLSMTLNSKRFKVTRTLHHEQDFARSISLETEFQLDIPDGAMDFIHQFAEKFDGIHTRWYTTSKYLIVGFGDVALLRIDEFSIEAEINYEMDQPIEQHQPVYFERFIL